MKDMKKYVLLLFIVGTIVIFVYQFFLNFNNITFSSEFRNSRPTHQKIIHFNDEHNHKEDDSSLAVRLSKEVKVLCWVMTSPANHKTKAPHVMNTWGKRCNKLLFASESLIDGEGLPILVINTTKGREHLTAKTIQTFDYLYLNELDEYDWFLKADDDTYVIVENLRYFLSSKDPSDSVYFGHHFHKYIKQGYFSGGAGYVMSRAGLQRFGQRRKGLCALDDGAEDVQIGQCMDNIGVLAGDSRDSLGRSRFHCFTPLYHITGTYPEWYYDYDKYGGKKGIGSMSDYSISYHYIDTDSMYLFDFFLYHLRPYGIINNPQDLNVPKLNLTTLGPPIFATFTTPHTITLPADLNQPSSPSMDHGKFSTQQLMNTHERKKKRRRRRTTIMPDN